MEREPLDESSQESHWLFPRLWAVFLLLLIAVTFPLWCVQDQVPAVAMFGWVSMVPSFMGWLPPTLVAISAVMVVLAPQRFRLAWWVVAVGLVAAFVLDQHRLQPWAYQSAIYATVFASLQPTVARRLLIPLAASIYIYSAAGKLDYQFIHSVGQDFLQTLLGPTGVYDSLSEISRVRLAFLFPVVELAAGILLMISVTRRVAGWIVIGLHASLVLMLSPLGLNHSLGVLLWNIALMGQAWFLFIAPALSQPRNNRALYRDLFGLPRHDQPRVGGSMGRLLARCVILIALVAPATERTGLWDHWTSWALYSPHSSRIALEIHRSALAKLPDAARRHVQEDSDGDGWQVIALNRWSLESLGVPVYPQARYQLALARELAIRSEIDDGAIRCALREMSNRMNGARREKGLLGIGEIETELKELWLVPNTDA